MPRHIDINKIVDINNLDELDELEEVNENFQKINKGKKFDDGTNSKKSGKKKSGKRIEKDEPLEDE